MKNGRKTPREGADFSGTNLEHAGAYNQRVMLQAVRVNGPITRSDLVDLTGLTAPTIANITRRLVKLGLIGEAGRRRGGRGQPAMRLVVNPDGAFSIGVNIDRDHMTIMTLDLAGRVRVRASREVAFAMPNAVAKFFRDQTTQMFAKGGVPRARVIGIGVAAPDDLGRVNLPGRPPKYDVWNTTDVVKLFGGIVPLPVLVENDAIAAAMGELQFGHGLQATSFLYILVSAGLGGGLVIDGAPYRGAQGRSGELGFLPLKGRGGGALQDVVSLSALHERLAAKGVSIVAPEQLTDLAKAGADIVESWLGDAAERLTDPLLAVNCLINPNAVFLGGRLPAALVDRLADRLNARLARHAKDIPAIAPVRRAAMSADAPAIGAAILPFNAQLFPTRAALMKTGAA